MKESDKKRGDSVRAFGFDLGNVLLLFDIMQAVRRIGTQCDGGVESVMGLLKQGDLTRQLETGLISGAQFFDEMKRATGYKGEFEEFLSSWGDIFQENAPMVALMRRLRREGFPVYLMSNTSDLHINFINARFPFMREFDGRIFSYEQGVMKPDAAFYRRLLERYGHQAHEVAFVDDVLANVEGARAIGMRGVHYQNAEQAEKELLELASGTAE